MVQEYAFGVSITAGRYGAENLVWVYLTKPIDPSALALQQMSRHTPASCGSNRPLQLAEIRHGTTKTNC